MNKHPQWIIKYVHNSKVNAVRIVDWEHHHEVATVRDVYTHNGESSDGAKAAALIAAAPELLDALKTIQEQLKGAWARAHYEEIRVAMQTTRAAIEKVEA